MFARLLILILYRYKIRFKKIVIIINVHSSKEIILIKKRKGRLVKYDVKLIENLNVKVRQKETQKEIYKSIIENIGNIKISIKMVQS